MPLMRFDLYEGRSDEELKKLLDTAHSVTVEVLKIPARDRYQIVNEHQSSLMIVEDTGLAIPRTNYFVNPDHIPAPDARDEREILQAHDRGAREAMQHRAVRRHDELRHLH